MTGAKTTVRFTEAVLVVLDDWKKRGWDLQEIVNTGVMVFQMVSPNERERAQRFAHGPSQSIPRLTPVEFYKAKILDTLGAEDGTGKQFRTDIWLEIAGDPRLNEDDRIDLAAAIQKLGGAQFPPMERLAQQAAKAAVPPAPKRTQKKVGSG